MTLYKGQQKVAPIINTATTINNQNKVFNSNICNVQLFAS